MLIEKTNKRPEMIFKDSAFLEGFLFSKGVIISDKKDDSSICFAKKQWK